jgi:hypothetical protein
MPAPEAHECEVGHTSGKIADQDSSAVTWIVSGRPPSAEILTWPRAKLDPLQLSLKMQVWRVVFMFGVRAMLDGTQAREADRERDRQRILAEFARDLRPADSRP